MPRYEIKLQDKVLLFSSGCLLSCMSKHVIDASDGDFFREGNASLVIRLVGGRILKLIKARSFHETVRGFWGADRAHKEIKGNLMLRQLQISVPRLESFGYAGLKSSGFRGFMLMEDLSSRGYFDARSALTKGLFDTSTRQVFFNNLYADIKTMYQNKLVFNDLKLPNIFTNEQGAIVWIDTGVSSYRYRSRYTLKKKHHMAIDRFIKRKDISLSSVEKQQLLAIEKEQA